MKKLLLIFLVIANVSVAREELVDVKMTTGTHLTINSGAFQNFVTGAKIQLDGTNVGASQLLYSNASQNIVKTTITTFGLSLLNTADAAAVRTLIGASDGVTFALNADSILTTDGDGVLTAAGAVSALEAVRRNSSGTAFEGFEAFDLNTPQTPTNKTFDGIANIFQHLQFTSFDGYDVSTFGLVDPNADRVAFWDESKGSGGGWEWLTMGTGLSISGTTLNAAVSSAAPTDATYITQTANATLSAEQALGALSTGIMKVTTTTGQVTSITDNSTNWDTAYTDRNKWDGGATGLTAATGRTSLGLGALATVTPGTGVATALAINIGSAGAPVLFDGALGTPSSGTITNLTGTASININGTVGATTPAAGTFTTGVFGSTTSLLLGTAGSAVGNIGFRNATSGTVTLAPPTGALGTYTVTLPSSAGTLALSGSFGDVSSDTATSVDAEVALFKSTTGKLIKRANGFSGIAKLTSGVLTAVTAPSGTIVGDTDTQTISGKTINSSTLGTSVVTGSNGIYYGTGGAGYAKLLYSGTLSSTVDITFPDISGGTMAIVGTTATQTLTNKTLTAPVSTSPKIGASGTTIVSVLSASASVNFASIGTLAEDTKTITVTGVATTNTPTVALGWAAALEAGIVVKQAWVSGADTVSITVVNTTVGTVDPAAVTARATVTSF